MCQKVFNERKGPERPSMKRMLGVGRFLGLKFKSHEPNSTGYGSDKMSFHRSEKSFIVVF